MNTTERPIIKMKDKTITIDKATQIVPELDNMMGSLGYWMQEWKQLHGQTEDIMNESNARGWSWIEHLEHMSDLCDDIGKFLEARLQGGLPSLEELAAR